LDQSRRREGRSKCACNEKEKVTAGKKLISWHKQYISVHRMRGGGRGRVKHTNVRKKNSREIVSELGTQRVAQSSVEATTSGGKKKGKGQGAQYPQLKAGQPDCGGVKDGEMPLRN